MLYISQIIFISAISSETPGYCEVNFRDAIICFQMRKQDQRGKRLAEGDKKKKKKKKLWKRLYIWIRRKEEIMKSILNGRTDVEKQAKKRT